MLKEGKLEYLLNTPSREKWKRVGLRRRTGVLVPLFSVYSKNSIGVGELGDLKLLVDFAVRTANHIIQLLPMNEIGALLCPYDSITSFALESAYISLAQLILHNKYPGKAKLQDLKKRFPTGRPYRNRRCLTK